MFLMKTLFKQQMWWMIILAILSAALYAYSISSSVKVLPNKGCSSCPNKDLAGSV